MTILLSLTMMVCQLDTDLLVNDDTSCGASQFFPALAVDDSGYYYCVWTDFRMSDYDGDVYVQRYLPDGRRYGHNVCLSTDVPSRDIWTYTTDRNDVMVSNNRLVVLERNRRLGDFDIFLKAFTRSLDSLTPMLRLNDDPPGIDQSWPKIARTGLDRHIAVWTDLREGHHAIYGQVLDSAFEPVGANFRISEPTSSGQDRASVAGWREGFAVAWCQVDGDSLSVYCRVFNPDGIPLSPGRTAFKSATTNPFCVMDTCGNFWVGAEESRTGSRDVLVTLFAPDGTLRGGPFQVSDPSPMPVERFPAASVRPDRDLMLVTFVDRRVTEAIWAQWIDSLGNRWGPNFEVCRTRMGRTTPCCLVRTTTDYAYAWEDSRDRSQDIYWYYYGTGESRVNEDVASSIQDFPVIGIDDQGRSLVAWFDYRNALWDADIYAQWYTLEGLRDGPNFRVNDDGSCRHQHFLRTAVNPAGNAVLVWRDSRDGPDNFYGQLFRPDHSRAGPNFLVTDTCGPLYSPQVSMNAAGDFLVGWSIDGRSMTQLYRADGTRIGDNRGLGPSREWIAPVLLDDRSYYVASVWEDRVLLARYDSLGRPMMGPAPVAGGAVAGQVALFRDPVGVLWAAWVVAHGPEVEVFGRRCDSTGAPLGDVFLINDNAEPCEHMFPCWACDGASMYVTFTDFRDLGDLNVMAQAYDLSGNPLGGNYYVNHDPHPFCHQWAWQSVAAAASGFVAYTWIDNRNARSWDIYFRLHTQVSGIREPEPELIRTPGIVRAGSRLRLDPAGLTGDIRARLYDRQGRMVREVHRGRVPDYGLSRSLAGVQPGIYFVRLETPGSEKVHKLVVVD